MCSFSSHDTCYYYTAHHHKDTNEVRLDTRLVLEIHVNSFIVIVSLLPCTCVCVCYVLITFMVFTANSTPPSTASSLSCQLQLGYYTDTCHCRRWKILNNEKMVRVSYCIGLEISKYTY